MTRHASSPVLFCAAAGPRLGFGHLVRCRSLARALGVLPIVALHGTSRTRAAAAALGLLVVPPTMPLDATGVSLVVVDDPSPVRVRTWIRRARQAGVPVVSVHDLGLGYSHADLLVDGTVCPGTVPPGISLLAGPDYAILDPAFDQPASRREQPSSGRVLVALGGGQHVQTAAARLAAAIAAAAPAAEIRIVAGFAAGQRATLEHGSWVRAPHGLLAELAAAQVAVVAGGVTLYEACAVGTATVGLAVTAAQHDTVRAMARFGAVIDGGCLPLDPGACERTAAAVSRLLTRSDLAARQSVLARRLVDGRGARRVADRLNALLRRHAHRPRTATGALAHAC